jgi:NitT/TauT family transport system permease protein
MTPSGVRSAVTRTQRSRDVSSTLEEPAASATLIAVRGPVIVRRVGSTMRTFGPPLLVFAGFLGFWYFMTYVVLDPDRRWLLPPPHAVIIDGLIAPEPRSEILRGLALSAVVAFIGLTISFVLGTLGAILMSQAKWIERSLYPYAVLMQTIPVLAIVPLLGFWFGLGVMARVIVCVIISLFPLVINTLTGLLGADRGLHDLMTLHNASRWTRLVRLQIPSAMPDIFTALRTSAGLSVIGAIVGDFFFGRGPTGLGLLISRYGSRLQSEKLLAAVLVACGFGVLVFTLFGVLGRRAVGGWSEAWRDPGDT